MASKIPARPFTQISPFVYHSPGIGTPSLAAEPGLIVVFGWMDANLRHVGKYASGYAQIFPSSPLLIIQSTSRQFMKRAAAQEQDIIPAIQILKEAGLVGEAGRKKLLVHCFSNGGVAQMAAVARGIRGEGKSRGGEEEPLLGLVNGSQASLSPATMLLDSCPGVSSLGITIKAFSMPFQSTIAKAAVSCLVSVFYVVTSIPRWFSEVILRRPRPQPIERLRIALNDPLLFSPATPRTYIYSKEDVLIDHVAVENHAKEANLAGFKSINLVRFEGTSHVAHERGDPTKYWTAVKEAWEASCKP